MSRYIDIKRHDEIKDKFAEAVYQKMASKRYGIEFCCKTELNRVEIHNEILRLNDIKDIERTSCDFDEGSYSDDFSNDYDNEF